MREKRNKYKEWKYTVTNTASRKKVKRLRMKVDRRIRGEIVREADTSDSEGPSID